MLTVIALFGDGILVVAAVLLAIYAGNRRKQGQSARAEGPVSLNATHAAKQRATGAGDD